jgi:hypothetical protein
MGPLVQRTKPAHFWYYHHQIRMLPDILKLLRQELSQVAYPVDRGAGNHKSGELAIPANVTLAQLPAHSPELNPQENI